MKQPIKLKIIVLSFIVLLASFMVFEMPTRGEPEGATVTYISNSTKNATSPENHTADKGTITIVNLDTIQQNIRWKAYVGNISGTLVLRDADTYSIYEWPSGGSPDGEVYLSRNISIDWASIQCANDTQIGYEDQTFGNPVGATDSVNHTFSYTIHESIEIGEITIQNSTCKSLFTWVNDTSQTASENALFQEVLLMDKNGKIVYTGLIDQDGDSYRLDNATYDFQVIVPDYRNASIATYWFYLEISG